MLDAQGGLVAGQRRQGVVMLLGPDGAVADTLDADLVGAGRGVRRDRRPGGPLLPDPCFTPSGVQVSDADGTRSASWSGAGLAQAPRWGADGRGYAVTADGGIVEVRAGRTEILAPGCQ